MSYLTFLRNEHGLMDGWNYSFGAHTLSPLTQIKLTLKSFMEV